MPHSSARGAVPRRRPSSRRAGQGGSSQGLRDGGEEELTLPPSASRCGVGRPRPLFCVKSHQNGVRSPPSLRTGLQMRCGLLKGSALFLSSRTAVPGEPSPPAPGCRGEAGTPRAGH